MMTENNTIINLSVLMYSLCIVMPYHLAAFVRHHKST